MTKDKQTNAYYASNQDQQNNGGVNGGAYRQSQQPAYTARGVPSGRIQQPSKDAQTPKSPKKQKGKRPVSFYVAIVVAVLALVACGVFAITALAPDKPTTRAGELGQLEGKTPEEVQAELDRFVEEGMFNVSIASVVDFPDGASEGEIKIENVPGNLYLMQVDITRNDTGETIYKSGILEPNHHIQRDKLAVDLDPGVYECTAMFSALDPDTEEKVGSAAVVMTINVQG